MSFLDDTTNGTTNSGDEKRVSSTLELAKKLGLLDKDKSNSSTKELNDSNINDSDDFLDILIEEDNSNQEIKNTSFSNKNNSDSEDSFITLNIDTNDEKETNSNTNDKTISLKDEDNSSLIDFLLNDDNESNNIEEKNDTDIDISIDDVDEKTLQAISKSNKDVDNDSDTIDTIDEINDIKEESVNNIKNDEKSLHLNDGLLVTPQDIDNYFANLKNKEEKSKKITQQEEKSSDPTEFDITKNIVENKPKTVSEDDILTFQSFEFKGKAREYFKIWIVNIALTILTLGLYSAWAKVRNLRYIYGNTYLNNSNFEFNADPRKILYGRIIILLFYGVFLLASNVLYNQTLALSVVGLFILLLPWLIKQAIRFKLKSVSYRNIRFKYHGKSRSFYLLAFGALLGLAVVFAPLFVTKYTKIIDMQLASTLYTVFLFIYLFIGIPIIYKKYKEIMINNSSYGDTMFSFHATKSGAVGTFFKIGFTTAIAGFIFGLLLVLPIKLLGINFNSIESLRGLIPIIGSVVGATIYLAFIGLYKGITDGYLSNFIRNNTKLGEGEFKSSIYPYKLGIISMTNMVAIVLSFGLLYPWAKMRYLKYKIENTQFACKDYSKFKATDSKDVSTIGEEATDFFDIDIGV